MSQDGMIAIKPPNLTFEEAATLTFGAKSGRKREFSLIFRLSAVTVLFFLKRLSAVILSSSVALFRFGLFLVLATLRSGQNETVGDSNPALLTGPALAGGAFTVPALAVGVYKCAAPRKRRFSPGQVQDKRNGPIKNDGGIKTEFESSESVINVGKQPVARA